MGCLGLFILYRYRHQHRSEVDPGISRDGGSANPRTINVLFDIIFAENCMEMKKIGVGRALPQIRHW